MLTQLMQMDPRFQDVLSVMMGIDLQGMKENAQKEKESQADLAKKREAEEKQMQEEMERRKKEEEEKNLPSEERDKLEKKK